MTETPYDVLPYESDAIPATRPGHVALTSWLHGGPRPEVERPRVLDVGCGDGTNLIALAAHNPEGTYVGFDYAQVQIDAGREAIAEIGLDNATLEVADIGDPTELEVLGDAFDVILIHGVYSWVPGPLRRALLALCAERLAPSGVAYVSYNVHPGWTVRGLIRELVRGPTAGFSEPRARAAAALELGARRLGALPAEPDHPYQALIARELRLFDERSTSSLVHEYLAEINTPFYFSDFLAGLGEHGLAYVADAMFNKPGGRVPDALRARLQKIGFRGAELEQLIDLLRYRQFRASLLCRSDARRPEPPTPERLAELYLTTHVSADGPLNLRPNQEASFRDPEGTPFKCADPLLKATLTELEALTPAGDTLAGTMSRAVTRLAGIGLGIDPPLDKYAQIILMLHRQGVLELHLRPPRLPAGLPPPPLARFEARHRRCATTPFHGTLPLDAVGRWLIEHLAAGSTRDALLEALRRDLHAGALTLLPRENEDEEESEALARRLDETLALLHRRGVIGDADL